MVSVMLRILAVTVFSPNFMEMTSPTFTSVDAFATLSLTVTLPASHAPNGAFVLSKVILVIYLFLFLVVLGLCCCSGYSPVAVFRLLIVVASFAAELGR